MSMNSILIYRDLPIINGYIQLPPCRETEKTKRTMEDASATLTGESIVRLSLGSGRQTGSKFGQQEFLRLPPITPNTWYSSDPVAAIGGDS